MAEIKSTLDIVMEKTRHLSLSDEEKTAGKVEDIRRTLRGMIQKYQDGALRDDQFKERFDALDPVAPVSNRRLLVSAIAERIDLDQDNSALLALLETFCDQPVHRLGSLLSEYSQKINAARGGKEEKIRRELSETHGISGSAVVPNLDDDDALNREILAIRDAYRKRLSEQARKLQQA